MPLSKELRNFVTDLKDSKIDGLHISDREGLEMMGAMLNQLEGAYKLILWNSGAEGLNGTTANTAAALIATGHTNVVKLAMADSGNTINTLSQGNQVTLTLTGTATNKTIDIGDGAGFVAGPVVVKLVDGEATVTTKADYATTQTLVLTMSAPSAGKTADGTYTITAP
jgi:adenosine/AMP kinase